MSYVSPQVRAKIRQQARNCCGYCQSEQKYILYPLEIEHIKPLAKGGLDEESNLWLACRLCNNYKSDQIEALDSVTKQITLLFNPRTQNWHEHFKWNEEGIIILGVTSCGRATVDALQLNNDLAVMVRREWIKVGFYPPKD